MPANFGKMSLSSIYQADSVLQHHGEHMPVVKTRYELLHIN